jgi:hypothetical protein
MLPKAKHFPSSFAQQADNFSISALIPPNLQLPEGSASFRHPAMPPAAVPETPVDEDRYACFPKHKIWPAWQRLLPTPSPDAMGAQSNCQSEFRSTIAPRANGCHNPATFFLRERIRHIPRLIRTGPNANRILVQQPMVSHEDGCCAD